MTSTVFERSRIELLSEEAAKKAASEVELPEAFTQLNVFRLLLHSPKVAKAVSELLLAHLFGSNFNSRQRELIIRHIAASRPVGEVTILDSLTELERDLGQNTSLVVITAATDGQWVEALGGFSRRGVRVNTVLIDRASFGGDPNADVLEHLTIVGVSTYPLARGDSIANALLSPVGGAREGLRQATFRTRSELAESAESAGLAESAGSD